MAFKVIPTILEGQVINVSVSFDKPISIAELKTFIKRLEDRPRVSKKSVFRYEPECIKEPIYSNGEIIAILEKYPDGTTKRNYV